LSVGCGAQGLNQGSNMRDSGLIFLTLCVLAIAQKGLLIPTFDNGFKVGTYEELIPTADLVCNLTPDKQHTAVVTAIMPLMKNDLLFSIFAWFQYCGRRNANS
jgi:ketol-acid reductoisomerase